MRPIGYILLAVVIIALGFLAFSIIVPSFTLGMDATAEVIETEAPVIAEVTPIPIETDPGGEPWLHVDMTDILDWIIRVLIFPILLRLASWVKAKVGEKKFELLLQAVTLGVSAAEEQFRDGHGPQKYAYVVDYLKRRGFSFDEAEINAVVFEEFNKFKREMALYEQTAP